MGRATGFVVYNRWPCTGSTSMTDRPLAALAMQLSIKINIKNLIIFIYFFPFFNYFCFFNIIIICGMESSVLWVFLTPEMSSRQGHQFHNHWHINMPIWGRSVKGHNRWRLKVFIKGRGTWKKIIFFNGYSWTLGWVLIIGFLGIFLLDNFL